VATDRLIRAVAGAFDLPLDCFHWRPLDQTEP
jgi:hypothetical protein